MAVPVIFFHLLLAFGTAGCAGATPFVEGVAAVLPAEDTVVWSATGTAKYNYIIWAQNFIVDDGFCKLLFLL